MEFSNTAIDLSSLPRAEEVNLQPIEPSYRKVLQLSWLITALVLMAIAASVIFFIKALHKDWIIALASAVWLLIVILQYWAMSQSFRRKAYALREKDMLYRTGWIIRRLHICPFNRVQHCSVHAGPLERKYGLASLSLYTAGSEGSDLRIPGLTESTAASLREFIMQKVRTDEHAAD